MAKGKETKGLGSKLLRSLLSFLMFFSVNILGLSEDSIAKVEKKPIIYNYGNLPLYFIKNDGQIDNKVKFYEKAAGHSMFFTEDGIYITMTKYAGEEKSAKMALKRFRDELKAKNAKSEVIKLRPLNARKGVEIVAEEEQSGRVNYFIGNDPKKWKTDIPTYRKVRYKGLYEGVDIVFYGNNNQLEYDIIARPGADISKIAFEYEGIKDLQISEEGDLVALLPSGEKIIQKKPVVYQTGEDGSHIQVDGDYKIIDSGKNYIFKFSLKNYDKNKPVTIDPVLIYSTYLGGYSQDGALGIAVDSQGNAFVAGFTLSTDFPLKNPIKAKLSGGDSDAFIAKISASGTELIYSTYLGGSDYDVAEGIAVDSQGNAYVAGETRSTDFPLKNPIQANLGGVNDAFITKISASGTELIYSTYLGGLDGDKAWGIAVDSQGNAYVAGETRSTDFPLKNPIQANYGGGNWDAFTAKICASGTELIYSTYLGGGGEDHAIGIAVDSQGNAYVVGWTDSSDFPLKNPIQAGFGGGGQDGDAFITKISASGNELIYSSYLGGSSNDYANGIAVDSQGNAYIVGETGSTNFPLRNPIQAIIKGYYDVFIAKLNSFGTEIIYSTYLGGWHDEFGEGIAIDFEGNAYIAGYTDSSNFPLKNPIQPNFIEPGDAFISKISASGTELIYSTYLGGGSWGKCIAVDSQGNAYVAGRAYSTNFPLKNPIQPILNGSDDAFIAKIGEQSAAGYTLTLTKLGTGSGTVSSDPAGINCGSTCSYVFAPGTIVTLTATADGDSYFSGWGGACSGTYPVTTITMDSDKTVSATFTSLSGATLSGRVYNIVDQKVISGATVSLGGGISTTTNSNGYYEINGLKGGDYVITVSKPGFIPYSESISIVGRSITKYISLKPQGNNQIVVYDIKSKYSGHIYFMDGISYLVQFTAYVDWGGNSPGFVRFITPKSTYDIPANGNTATITLDVGSEFGVCGKLKAKAFSGNISSEEKTADFTVASAPPLIPPKAWRYSILGDAFYLGSTMGYNLGIISDFIDGSAVPEDIPFFGKLAVGLNYIPTLTAEYSSNGSVLYTLDWSNKPLWEPKGTILGMSFSLVPGLNIEGHFNDSSCSWSWAGGLTLSGSLSVEKVARIPQTLYLAYLKGSFDITGTLSGLVEQLVPFVWTGSASISATGRGAIGAGFDLIASIEAWISGGGTYEVDFPGPGHDFTIELSGGVRLANFLHYKEDGLFKCSYSFSQGTGGCTSPLFSTSKLKQMDRDYLKLSTYGRFEKGKKMKVQMVKAEAEQYALKTAAIQSTIFPYSSACLTSAGNSPYLIWLYDDPNRTSMNRTMAVFSKWTGSDWTDPVPVADDGTADFHPKMIGFQDGSAVAIWEDIKTPLPDSVSYDEFISNLEISAAIYDPATGTWSQKQRLTDNNFMDRSPIISGPGRNNVIAVWIANTQNDDLGSAGAPNQILYAKFDGTSWSTPAVIASVDKPILKYSLAYNGTKGYLVMSLDVDGSYSTVDDRELYYVDYDNGTWGNLTQLTNDSIVDDNPQIAFDKEGNLIMVWMKGQNVVYAVNLSVSDASVISEIGYTANSADFKVASTFDGNIAIVWAEPSGFASDIMAIFYDPLYQVWSKRRQLTFDEETEKFLTTTFIGNQSLMVVYDRTPFSVTSETKPLPSGRTITLSIPKPGATDLYMVIYGMGNDLAIKNDSLSIIPENPTQGTNVEIKATVINSGSKAISNIPVRFYNGDPASSGSPIGSTTIAETLAPGDGKEVSIQWTTPTTNSSLDIYVVVDPDKILEDNDRSNNYAHKQIIQPDLTIVNSSWQSLGNNTYLITAQIKNIGSLPAAGFNVTFRKDSSSGQLIGTRSVSGLNIGETTEVSIEWNPINNAQAPYLIFITADEENSTNDFSRVNNTKTLKIEVNQATLTITKSGSGSGLVTSADGGINCGSQCSYIYPAGTLVTLTATPDSNSIFSGWSGDISSTNSTITINLDSDKTVVATFNPKPLPDLCGEWVKVSTSKLFIKSISLRGNLRIRNSGDANTSGTFIISYYLSNNGSSLDTLIGTQRMSLPISAGGSRTILFIKNFADKNSLAGKYLIAVIDSQNNIAEKDETNNRVIFGPL